MTNEEKLINLCETSDFVLVDGRLGIYYKKYETIMFPRNGLCPPDIKVRDYDYYEEGGEKWILPRNGKVGRYHIRFLNEVKGEKQSVNPPKLKIDEKPTIPTIVGPIKNYLHRPLG